MSQITPQNRGLVQQANQPAQKIVEVIDVLAGEGDYVAAFEVKHTLSLYSSLLLSFPACCA